MNMFGPVSSGVRPAGNDRRRRVEELLLHVGLFDEHTGSPQQHDAVEHLQSDHPVHRDTHTEKDNVK